MSRTIGMALAAATMWWSAVHAQDQLAFPYSVPEVLGVDEPVVLLDSIIHPVVPTLEESGYNIIHCFSDDKLPDMLSQGAAEVIIHHGIPTEVQEYARIYSHTETLPFFVNKEAGVGQLSSEMAGTILAGAVTNWTDVGGNDWSIKVYGPASELKRNALWRIVEASEEGVEELTLSGVGTYQYLAEAVSEYEGALSLGLRSRFASEKYLSSAVRVFPTDEDGIAVFSVPIFLYVKKDSDSAFETTMGLLRQVTGRAAEDGYHYPLEVREAELKKAMGR